MAYESTRARQRSVNRGFKWVLILSFALHFGIFGAVVYAQSRKPARAIQNAVPVELVQLGKPRDPKLLPRKVRRAPPPPPDDAVNLDTGKKPQPKKKPEREKPKPEKPRDPDDVMSDRARQLLDGAADSRLDDALSKIETPEGSPDGVVGGTTTDPAKAAKGYAALAGASLTRAYELPDLLRSQRQFLAADILIHVKPDGRIARYEVVKRHPNDLFMSALEKLLNNHQLPPPPRALAERFEEEGILLKFKP